MGTSHFTRAKARPAELMDKSPTILSVGEPFGNDVRMAFSLIIFYSYPKN
jgi:hypothetical protein